MRDSTHPKYREEIRLARARLLSHLPERPEWREDELMLASGASRAVIRFVIEQLTDDGVLRPFFTPRHGHPTAVYRYVAPSVTAPVRQDVTLTSDAHVVLHHLTTRCDTLRNMSHVLRLPGDRAQDAVGLLQAAGLISCRYVGGLAIFAHAD